MDIKQLREEAAQLSADNQAIIDASQKEERSFSTDETVKFDENNERLSDLKASIESQERISKFSASQVREKEDKVIAYNGRKPITKRDHELALRAFCLSGTNESVSDDMMRAADRMGINVHSGTLAQFDQTIGTATEGGNNLNGSIWQAILTAEEAYGGIASISNVLNTSTGEPIHFSTVNDVDNLAVVHAENIAVANVDLTFGKKSLSSFSLASAVFKVSMELLNDVHFDLGSYIGTRLGERVSRAKAAWYVNGTGSSQPLGLTNSTVAVASFATTDAIIADDIYDLYFGLNSVYRQNGKFIMNDKTLSDIVKIEDLNNRPLFSGLTEAPGTMLMGKEIVVVPELPDQADGISPIYFGDFSSFYVRNVKTTEVHRMNERYLDTLSVGFLAWARTDALYINEGTNPIVKLTTTATGS